MVVDRQKIGRNSKSRGKLYERVVAKILGATRHKADTGGDEDLEHPVLSVQVKSGVRLVNSTISSAVDAGRTAKGKLGCAVLVERGGPQLRYYIVFDLKEYAEWNGFGDSQGDSSSPLESFTGHGG